jgi:hypothetical protein
LIALSLLPSESPSSASAASSSHGPREDLQSHREIQGEVVRAQGKSTSIRVTTATRIATATRIDLCGTDKSHRHAATVNVLPDDVLLEIFDFHRSNSSHDHPWEGDRLVHACLRWRQIIFGSPCRLRLCLKIHCTPGTPVRTDLGCLPAFPIVVDYSINKSLTGKLSRDDEDNVLAALEHSNRVCRISLELTASQWAKLATTVMQESFPVLTHLSIHLDYHKVAVLPGGFLGGSAPCLQELHLEAVPFPELPTLLLSAHDLVILRLRSIPSTGYISPEMMVACLAALPKLETLLISFWNVASDYDQTRPTPAVTRTVVPALTSFEYSGVSRYLEDLVARIDCPQLNSIEIRYWPECFNFQLAQLFKFINRSEDPRLTLSSWVDVSYVYCSFSLKFYHAHRYDVTTSISFPWKASHLLQVFDQFAPMLADVRHLGIAYTSLAQSWQDELNHVDWVQLLRPFTAVQTLCLSGRLSRLVTLALEEYATGEMVAELLPSLDLLCSEYQPASSVADFAPSVAKFIATRRLSGHPVDIETFPSEFNRGPRTTQE